MTKKVKIKDAGSAIGGELTDQVIKEQYCKALKKAGGPYGGATCNKVFEKLYPLCLTPNMQKSNVEYRLRCESLSGGIDLLHCNSDQNKTK